MSIHTGVWFVAAVACAPEGPLGPPSSASEQAAFDVDEPVITLTWTAESDESEAQFGYAVSSAGDVNGDGFSDVIVGAPNDFTDDLNLGRAFVYLGSAAGLELTAHWSIVGEQDSDVLGSAVASAGDVNGDGYDDVIVGSNQFDDGLSTDVGRVDVFLGSAAGLAPVAGWTVIGDVAAALFGMSVASAGDVNFDGYDDVIVGAPRHAGFTTDGKVFLYLGSALGLDPIAAWTAESDVVGTEMGRSVASAGDVNGDGYSDVVVGSIGGPSIGRASLFLGSALGPSDTADWVVDTLPEASFSSSFGASVAGAGDVNGDGYDDVIVGADSEDWGNGPYEGKAYVYLGSAAGLSTTAAWTGEGDDRMARFGTAVASAGDVNGDGFADVVVGAPWFRHPSANEGRAYLYLGSAAGLSTAPAWIDESDIEWANFGWSASSAGDVDADGYDDVIVSAPWIVNASGGEGKVFVYAGRCDTCDAAPVLTPATPGIVGQKNTWELTGGPPGEDVVWLWSSSLGSAPAAGCAGLEVGLKKPNQLGLSVSDAGGVATFAKKVPVAGQGKTMHVQAVFPSSCVISNVATTLF